MNKKHRIWGNVVAILYIINFVLPSIITLDENSVATIILSWISGLIFIAAPILYFWLYRQEKRIGYLIAAIITLLLLILGVVAVIIVNF